ncbi:DUF3078 domain-containing protein [Natronogracilivirgula saccharolytica]|uniref:DUF3078 domain-containing protein n=2 Tax=Natronogracilivirga saccharolytica TaxID=2812953 RepID=A0A8J7UTH0_9BACT|nr:DUF3078 domain-containing protein [Natronogracilivirga saccharolytica]
MLSGAWSVKAQQLPMPTDDLLNDAEEEGDWDFTFRVGINGSQAYYREWAQGGVDRIAVIGNTVFTGVYTEGPYQYGLRVNLRYGQTRQDRGAFRKSDDRIRIRNQFRRKFEDERFSLTANINFETQFDKGYDRDFEEVQSRFMAPGTLTETVGLSYDPDSYLESTVGISLRQTFISDTSLSERYGLDKGSWFRNEAGFTVILNYEREIWDNVSYTGYLETFSNLQESLLNTDFVITNEFEGKINDYLTTNFEFSMRYNNDVTNALQIKQILSVGLNFHFM